MRRLAYLGITPDLHPTFAKQIALTNLLGWLFAANMSISGMAFLYFGYDALALFTLFFVLTEISWPIFNHFKRYDLARVGMLITSNLLGLSVSVMLPDTGYNRGFFVMAGLPILLFSLKERRFIILGLLLPMVLYPFSEWAQHAVPETLGLSIVLSADSTLIIRYSVGVIYVVLIFLMFLFLSIQNARAEESLADQRARSFSSAKFAALGEMAGGIGHEINNPMMAIGLNVDLLKRMLSGPDFDRTAALEKIHRIKRVSGRVTQIIEAMQTFSREGEKEQYQKVPARKIVEETLTFCTEKFKNHGIELTVRMPEDEIVVECRPIQVSQVLLNLLNNAFDAVEGSRQKRVSLEVARGDSGGTLRIAVTDSGPGIPAEIREKIFQPFFTTKPVGRGTGLGLSLSRQLARDHGGELRLDTQSSQTRLVVEMPIRH